MKHITMDDDTPERAAWRAEFDKLGEESTWRSLRAGEFHDAKRQFAFHWFADQVMERTHREARRFRYLQFMLSAAVAGVAAGIVCLFLMIAH